MKRLRDITTRASLHELVEALIEATVVDGETTPEVKPEGEKEFVKLHKTEKHTDPDRLGNPTFSHKVKEAPYKKAPKDNGFPKEETELDESGAIAKAKGKAVLISRPKFDARGNVVLTKAAKQNITYGKKPRKLSGKTYKPGEQKRFGEEKELNEGGPTKKHFKMAAETIKNIEDEGKRKEHAYQHAEWFTKSNPRFDREKFYTACGLKKHQYKEETQLDELSRKTLTDFIKVGSTRAIGNAYLGAQLRDKDPDRAQKLTGKAIKHALYVGKAGERLGGTFEVGKPVSVMIPGKGDNDPASGPYKMKRKKIYHAEETQLDETSKEKAMNYARAAVSQLRGHAGMEGHAGARATEPRKAAAKKARWEKHEQLYTRKAKNREQGLQRALKKLGEEQIDEKAVSKAQQRLFGMAYAMRKGESDRGSEKVAGLAADLSKKKLRDFAKTKHTGLPERKEK